MWSSLTKWPRVHVCAYRDCNHGTIVVGYALRRSLGPYNNLATGSS
jgi:hypothetical protein